MSGPFEAEAIPPAAAGEADITGLADSELAAQLEALLVVSDGPLALEVAVAATGVPEARAADALGRLERRYRDEGHGFRLRQTAGGWVLFAAPEHYDVIHRAVVDQQPARLSAAALETLAVVAYRQPVTRGQIAAIRGVGVDAVMRTLVSRGLVEERGSDPGTGALFYGTTTEFLDRLSIRSVAELPELAPYMPDIDAVHGLDESFSI